MHIKVKLKLTPLTPFSVCHAACARVLFQVFQYFMQQLLNAEQTRSPPSTAETQDFHLQAG